MNIQKRLADAEDERKAAEVAVLEMREREELRERQHQSELEARATETLRCSLDVMDLREKLIVAQYAGQEMENELERKRVDDRYSKFQVSSLFACDCADNMEATCLRYYFSEHV